MTRRSYNLETLNPKLLLIGGSFTIGASGAISAQDGAKLSGGTVTQVASEDGRYLVTLDRTYKRVRPLAPLMIGPDDAAFPTTTGSDPQARLLTTSGFAVQFKRTDTQADADPASGTVCTWAALVAKV
jgi:hypothetical protein